MYVLVACEESQRVCTAFRERGHNAFSADIQEPSGAHPEWHVLGDVLKILNPVKQSEDITDIEFETMNGDEYAISQWDLIIAHPPCTYLSNAGACRLYPKKGELNEERYLHGLKAKDFFMMFYNAKCVKICIENPVPSRIFNLPEYTQIIQPFEYGHPYTKKTCLWLKGLPNLRPTEIVPPIGGYVCGNSEIWKRQAANGRVVGKEKSAKHRSKTFPGIARAMAEQWG